MTTTIAPLGRKHSWVKCCEDWVKTERICVRCALLRITDHSGPGIPFIRWAHVAIGEFASAHTPLCPPIELSSIAAA